MKQVWMPLEIPSMRVVQFSALKLVRGELETLYDEDDSVRIVVDYLRALNSASGK
jgi:hypothetical protein